MNKIIGIILLIHFLNKSKIVLINWINGNRNFNKEENMNLKQEIKRIKNGSIIFNKKYFGSFILNRSICDREMKEYFLFFI